MADSENPPQNSGGSNRLWNYRIVHDGDVYWLAEIYYKSDGTPDWFIKVDHDLRQGWSRQEDLITMIRSLAFALEQPYLRVTEAGVLSDVLA